MSILKRFTASLSASLDQAITQMENHDGVIAAALEEGRDAAARLQVQIRQHEEQRRRDASRQQKLSAERDQWLERAKALAGSDRDRAMLCLRRRDGAQREMDGLQRAIQQADDNRQRLEGELAALKDQLQQMEARRRELQGRELGAKGREALTLRSRSVADGVAGAFERWEVDVTRSELRNGPAIPAGSAGLVDEATDPLGDEFERAEEQARLQAELDAMLKAGEDEQ